MIDYYYVSLPSLASFYFKTLSKKDSCWSNWLQAACLFAPSQQHHKKAYWKV